MMAAYNSFSLTEEELSCPICFEEFNLHEKKRQPKLLLCLHTFCLACMETLQNYNGTLQCSICRTSHKVYRVCDLMDNYVIFEHLRIKQLNEDEKLAAQLKEEYEEHAKLVMEQEERDAELAREEGEKIRIEAEKKIQEELRVVEERERLRLERERLQLEERLKREEEERSKAAAAVAKEIEGKQKEDEEQIRQSFSVLMSPYSREESSEERESSSESTDTRSEETSDSQTEDDDDSFLDLENGPTEEGREDDDESATSLVDPDNDDDDYETLSSDTDNFSVVLSSDEDSDRLSTARTNTATLQSKTPDNRSQHTSPEPDLLSEEFSGVAQTSNALKSPEPLCGLIQGSNCVENSNGSIIILDSSVEQSNAECDDTSSCPPVRKKALNCHPYSKTNDSGDSSTSSEDEECFNLRSRDGVKLNGSSRKNALPLHLQNDENCELQ